MAKLLNHTYIFLTIFFTVYSQLVMRWQVSLAGPLPENLRDKVIFVASLLVTPWVLTALVSTFLAGLSWMLAMTKFEISYAFPFVSLNYVLILMASYFLFGESFSSVKLFGSMLIVAGILIISRG